MAKEKKLPKVNCRLVGEEGNCFAIMGRFEAAARKAGWSKEYIDKVLNEAMTGDYDHLLATIAEHCKNP